MVTFGTINLGFFIDYLKNIGKLNTSEFISGISFNFSVYAGAGKFYLNGLTIPPSTILPCDTY